MCLSPYPRALSRFPNKYSRRSRSIQRFGTLTHRDNHAVARRADKLLRKSPALVSDEKAVSAVDPQPAQRNGITVQRSRMHTVAEPAQRAYAADGVLAQR